MIKIHHDEQIAEIVKNDFVINGDRKEIGEWTQDSIVGTEVKHMVTTVEELKEYIDTHCHIGIDCEEENGEVWCINHASKELRDEYASKYGCICGACCRKCIQFKECFPDGDCKHLCIPEACRNK